MSLDLSLPIRTALLAESTVTDELTAYLGSYPIFTRVPVPDNVISTVSKIIVISPGMHISSDDGIKDERPLLSRDILIYGLNDSTNYRSVERMGFAIRDMFNHTRTALTVTGWTVSNIVARGPMEAPVDDSEDLGSTGSLVGRMVNLAVQLARQV